MTRPEPAHLGRLSPLSHDTYRDVKTGLRAFINDMVAAGEYRLPAEDQLSTMLGVSRPTVRSALLSLQKEGLLQRSHGRGTLVNKHAVQIGANLGEDRAFVDVIAALGRRPDVTTVVRGLQPLAADIAEKLGRDTGSEVVVLDRVFLGDDEPTVYAIDHVPSDLVRDVEAPGEESIFAYLLRNAGRRVRYSVADLFPVVAADDVADRLQLEPGAAVLRLLHTHIDQDDEPVAVTSAYIHPQRLMFSVVRTNNDV